MTLLEWYQLLMFIVKPLGEFLSQGNESERAAVKIPRHLPQAWLHGVMATMFLKRQSNGFSAHMEMSMSLLRRSAKEMIGADQESIMKKSSLRPFEILSLVNLELLGDLTGANSNIVDIYEDYAKRLVGPSPSISHRLRLSPAGTRSRNEFLGSSPSISPSHVQTRTGCDHACPESTEMHHA
jgi:hypothetical protein